MSKSHEAYLEATRPSGDAPDRNILGSGFATSLTIEIKGYKGHLKSGTRDESEKWYLSPSVVKHEINMTQKWYKEMKIPPGPTLYKDLQ